jgi:hypothetical protein
MTPEQVHEELLDLRVEIRKDFGDFKTETVKSFGEFKYDLTWRLVTILAIQTTIILGAVYFMISHWKP